MSWLDNIIGFLNPEWAARRAAWRSALDEIKSYDAGNYARLNAGWRANNYSAEMTDRTSRDIVRARARDLERNSDMMNSVLWAIKRNVIGSGFGLQAKTDSATVNEELETLWRRWCKARNCDVTGVQSLNEMLRMAVVRKHVDGGILFVKRYTKDGMIPFSLQLLEVDELDTMHSIPGNPKHRVVGGIEYNEYNRPMGYWFRQYQVDGYSIADPVYVKSDDVIFYFSKKRPSQIREMSDMAPTVTRIRDANEFMTAVSVKQRIEACLSVFIKKSLPVTGMGRTNTNGETRFDYDGKTLAPGMIRELNAGDDVEVVNPTGQSADATSFIKLHQRMIGAGQGISYEATSRDMSETNYSSARQGAIEDELTFAEETEKIIAILDEIYETFVISCYLAGLISVTGDFWSEKDKYFAHEWIKRPKKWIDPQKEAGATKTALNTGIKTYKEIAAENGTDWRTQINDMAEVLEYAKSKGIDLGGVLYDGKLEETDEEQPEGNPETAGAEEAAEESEDNADESGEDGESGSEDSNEDGQE